MATSELNIKVRGDKVEEATSLFRHLGSKVTRDGRCKEDIETGTAPAKGFIDLKIKKRLFKACVRSAALYGSGSWITGAPEKRKENWKRLKCGVLGNKNANITKRRATDL